MRAGRRRGGGWSVGVAVPSTGGRGGWRRPPGGRRVRWRVGGGSERRGPHHDRPLRGLVQASSPGAGERLPARRRAPPDQRSRSRTGTFSSAATTSRCTWLRWRASAPSTSSRRGAVVDGLRSIRPAGLAAAMTGRPRASCAMSYVVSPQAIPGCAEELNGALHPATWTTVTVSVDEHARPATFGRRDDRQLRAEQERVVDRRLEQHPAEGSRGSAPRDRTCRGGRSPVRATSDACAGRSAARRSDRLDPLGSRRSGCRASRRRRSPARHPTSALAVRSSSAARRGAAADGRPATTGVGSSSPRARPTARRGLGRRAPPRPCVGRGVGIRHQRLHSAEECRAAARSDRPGHQQRGDAAVEVERHRRDVGTARAPIATPSAMPVGRPTARAWAPRSATSTTW